MPLPCSPRLFQVEVIGEFFPEKSTTSHERRLLLEVVEAGLIQLAGNITGIGDGPHGWSATQMQMRERRRRQKP
ncbi:unnamed protein product, partial [Vitis vinifera]